MSAHMIPGRRSTARAHARALAPVLCGLAVLLAVGPVALALSDHGARARPEATSSLRDIARAAGCVLSEFDADPRSNPPVSGRVDERVTAHDGSYVGRRSPPVLATTHVLLHGRVVIQYRPGLPRADVSALLRLVRRDPTTVLLF